MCLSWHRQKGMLSRVQVHIFKCTQRKHRRTVFALPASRFSAAHKFEKPNDKRALDLMDECAKCVMQEFSEIKLAFGESDEYSFVLHKDTQLYGRRASKLVSTIASCFTGNYVRHWSTFLPVQPLLYTPVFDGRAVCYPTLDILRDYLSWRQADTHINNQYNTCYWCLVNSGKTPSEAQQVLKGTDTAFKNELLYSQFGINYAHLPEQFRKVGNSLLSVYL
eukprot:GHRR01031465.1.p1 GENE.GHRR01031465.1~~GHRR01031465.1.p1  ORF type:complete len:221 (+),score=12.57 GHRR01031465.1:158-820(+)